VVVFVIRPVELLVTLHELPHLLGRFFGIIAHLGLLHLLFELKLLVFDLRIFEVIVWRHIEPRMLKHLLGGGTSIMVPLQHRKKEVIEGLSLLISD